MLVQIPIGEYFYHYSWNVVGEDATRAVKAFFANGYIPHGFNSSFLILIPNSVDSLTIENFRPIILSNFMLKIITRLLASRLGNIAKEIISYHQFGFIPGKRIHDSIVVASDGINCLSCKAYWGNMALKIDIKKAFDTVRWNFLLEVLRSFGFCEKFILWIETINSAWISVLINGTPHSYFSCNRGVHQGDPFSPLFFSLAKERYLASKYLSQ